MSPRWEPNPDVRRGRHVVYNLHAHLVFVTRYRRNVFNDAMLTRCEEIMRKVCEDFGTNLIEFNGEEDHVYLLVHYPPKAALSKPGQLTQESQLPSAAAGGTSRSKTGGEFTGRVNRAIMHGRFWSSSYFAGSCGGTPLQVVKDYIENHQRPD
ncbi:IS200/IS605 family transposase [Streptomyces sp. NPDC001978]|uniref:IS200/IS605 family transposase n=1 Tax=Streptomyces sp. NPDC001978 TaxID=3364627 RepID=UPI0036C76A92